MPAGLGALPGRVGRFPELGARAAVRLEPGRRRSPAVACSSPATPTSPTATAWSRRRAAPSPPPSTAGASSPRSSRVACSPASSIRSCPAPTVSELIARWLEALMLTARIIPCLDVSHGRVVKGIRFQGLRDAGDPAERAALYEEQGADEIVILDVSATPEARGNQVETVQRVRARLRIPLTVGGGVRTVDDAQRPARGRRRQGLGQHGRGPPAGAARRDRRALRPPVHGAGDRRRAPRTAASRC